MRNWDVGEYLEILDHSPGSIRLERLRNGAPLLKDHDRTAQIGIIEKVDLQNRRLVVSARFGNSQVAADEAQDVADGIRRNVSVGYMVHRMELAEKRTSGPDVYRVTDWEPVEVSTVAIPADVSVGIGRSEPGTPIHRRIAPQGGIDFMTTGATPTTTTQPNGAPHPAVRDLALEERNRIREILAIGKHFKCLEAAHRAIEDGTSWEAFRDHVWERQTPTTMLEAPRTHLGMRQGPGSALSSGDVARYAEAFPGWLRSMVEGRIHDRSIVTEYSDHLSRDRNQPLRGERSILVDDAFWAPMVAQRDLSVGTTTAGGHLVATDLLASNFIEVLRPRSAVIQMGARTLPGLVGNVDIPRQTAGSAAGFVGEGSDISESQPVFDKISMVPRTLGVRTDVTRKLMLQSTPAILGVVQADIANGFATKIDATGLNGSGTPPIPRGVLNTSGIGSVTWVSTNGLTKLQSVIALLTSVAAANADNGSAGFITTPEVRAALMSVYPDAGAGQSVWPLTRDADGRSSLLGFPAATTNNVPKNLGGGTNEHALIFGNWSDLFIGLWGIFELQLDPFTLGDSGGMVLRGFQDIDFGVRHPLSFAKTTLIP